jgi:hypothetical protein
MGCSVTAAPCVGCRRPTDHCVPYLPLLSPSPSTPGMVATDWDRFQEFKANGLVKDVFDKQATLDKLRGG